MTHSQLIARLEQLTGPDREVDAEICCMFHLIGQRPAQPDDFDGRYGYSPGNIKCDTGFLQSYEYTASVDAVLALAEEVLPGWGWEIASNTNHIKACLNPEYGKPIGKYPHWASIANISSRTYVDGATPAIALCIAILRATSLTAVGRKQ